jgi:chitinase
MIKRVFSLLAIFTLSCAGCALSQQPQVIGYVLARGRHLDANEIQPRKLTRIQYAFLLPVNGEVSDKLPFDAENLATLVSLKQISPTLEVVVSIGGGAHSGAFSDIALTPESRSRFVASCLTLIEKYGLDGVDIDWEYPAQPRKDGNFRPDDKHNYTLLLRDLRQAFDSAATRLHKHLINSTATNGKAFFLHNTEMGEVSRYVDTVNLMGYDFYPGGAKITGNHSALLTDPTDPKQVSDDSCVQAYINAGVPAAKIVLGVPFFGHEWTGISALNHGLFQPASPTAAIDILYRDILSHDIDRSSGFVRYWDHASAVPWLYNDKSGTFITYDDPESLGLKASYVRSHHLGGVMFWSLDGDSNGLLLDALNAGLQRYP